MAKMILFVSLFWVLAWLLFQYIDMMDNQGKISLLKSMGRATLVTGFVSGVLFVLVNVF